MNDLSELKNKILISISETQSSEDLESIRVSSLGRKGSISLLMKELGKLQPQDRRERGKELNLLQAEINSKIQEQKKIFNLKTIEKKCLSMKWKLIF